MKRSRRGALIMFALLAAPLSKASAGKLDYTWAYDPLTHQPVLVCKSCWFWSCDCGETPT